MRRLICAAAAMVLLGGCSNYVSSVTPYELKATDDLKVDTYQDGERYVRLMKDKFQAKVQQLENEENFWKLGVMGGGVTTLVGVLGKHPNTAIVGAGVAGGSYVYGQAFGPDVLRRIYLNGDAALNCVLLIGTKMNADLAALQYYIGQVQSAKVRLERVLDELPAKVAKSNEAIKAAAEDVRVSERRKLQEVSITIASWNIPGGVIGKRMAVTTDIIRTKVNQLVKDNEATLSSLYMATGKASDIGIALKKSAYPGDTESTKSLVATEFVEVKEASAALAEAVKVANAFAEEANKKSLGNLDQFDSCVVADVDGPLLTFEPSDLKVKQGTKISVIVKGGRAPYTWVAVGQAPAGLTVTPSGSTGNSGIIQIEATSTAAKGKHDFAFSSLHPKAGAQIVKIEVE